MSSPLNKKRFVPHLTSNDQQQLEDFTNLLDNLSINYAREGSVVKGQVVAIEKDMVVVDVGLKNEGRIPMTEFTKTPESKVPEIGELVEVYVNKIENRHGKTILSREKVIQQGVWAELETAHNNQQSVNGIIFAKIKGGFAVDLSGVVAFLPGSQVDVRPIKDMTLLMNISQPFHILKMDDKLGNVIVSRRVILEESIADARNEILATIKEGMILDGIVKNITNYGAFVALDSVDGLLHLTDISWKRIHHPSEILSVDQKVRVLVTKFDEKTQRISLGMKQLEENPWEKMKNEFPVGTRMKGIVRTITDYGAFIELKPGIEALVHSSEISWVRSKQNPKKALEIGQEIECVILEVDTEKSRISVSIKQCEENPLLEFAQQHPIGSIIKGAVKNVTDFGIFIELHKLFDGLIHESDISWDKKGAEALQDYKKGDLVECQVLSVDIDKERIALGIKQLTEAPENYKPEFKKNMAVTCEIIDVKNDGLVVRVDDDTEGYIKRSELSMDKSDQKLERFAVGDRVDAKIIAVDKSAGNLSLSIKALEIEQRKKTIKEYGSADSGASLGDILGAALKEDKSE